MSTATLARVDTATADGVITLDLYCRISRDYDGTLRSVEDQEAWGRTWCAENGYAVGVVHRDHALSAWNPKTVRPEWIELMTRLRSGEAHGVWIRDIGRFTRKMREALDLRDAWELGRTIASGKSGKYDLSTAEGLDRFLSEAKDAEVESKRISDRTTGGKATKAQVRGRSNATHRGFARDGYLPNPKGWQPGDLRTRVAPEVLAAEVAAVRDAARSMLDGGTMAAVVADWNDRGLTTVTGRRWDSTRVREVLTAPSIAGLVSYKGSVVEGKTLPGEPVLDRDTYDRLLGVFAGRKRGRPAGAYLLSGIARCGRCGGVIYGRPLVSKPRYADGEVQRSYWCMPREKDGTGCGRVAMDQRRADAQAEYLVVNRLGDPRHADRVTRVRAKQDAARAVLLAELADLNAEVDAVTDKTGDPGWTVERIDKVVAKYGVRIEAVNAKLAALGEPDADDTTAEAAADAQAAWDAATPERRRRMVRNAFPEGLTLLPATKTGTASRSEKRIVPGLRVAEQA